MSDDIFNQAQAKLAENTKAKVPRAKDSIRAFTRMLFCGDCGSVCYARKSKNAKGEYFYYGCGCSQSVGPDACTNKKFVREDLLKDRVGSGGGGQSAELLVEASQKAFREAKLAFAESASDQQFNRSVGAAVGGLVLEADGSVSQMAATARKAVAILGL